MRKTTIGNSTPTGITLGIVSVVIYIVLAGLQAMVDAEREKREVLRGR